MPNPGAYQFAELCDQYRDRLTEWWAEVPMMRASPVVDQRDDFWSLVESNTAHRIPPPTKAFVNRWHEMVIGAANDSSIADNSDARFLIEDRERKIKPGRARIGNHQMLQDWGGKSGTAQLNFRWPTSSQIIEDIVRPLKE
jgi:phage regulator Rha-like protein